MEEHLSITQDTQTYYVSWLLSDLFRFLRVVRVSIWMSHFVIFFRWNLLEINELECG